MKIGEEVYIHGYVDEIRKDVIIIRNDGGYFGTVPSEVLEQQDILDEIRAEIDRQEKWLLQAGYTAYNVDIAFDAIKSVLEESEDKE